MNKIYTSTLYTIYLLYVQYILIIHFDNQIIQKILNST